MNEQNDTNLIVEQRDDEHIIYKHPSFGMIEVSEISCGGNRQLFGSSLEHRNTLRIRVYRGYMDRYLNNDWFHTQNLILELEMSKTQWAEFLTSLNHGGGVPCTLLTHIGEEIPDFPKMPSKREVLDNECKSTLDKSVASLEEAIRQVKELMDKKTVSKTDRQEILNLIEKAKRGLDDHIPFIEEQFREEMDKTVLEAKSVVENWTRQTYGVESENFLKLDEYKEA